MSSRVTKRAVEDLLLQTRQLRERLTVFKQSALEVAVPLDKAISEAEALEMATARANVLGALECLLDDDLEPALRKLAELDCLLSGDSQPLDLLREPVLPAEPFMPAATAERSSWTSAPATALDVTRRATTEPLRRAEP
ncbi:MAG TPA: hypothetical protein VGX68_14290 [Thermoanaerobaculia bacterium]|jgi:hypothetical protein|nr:hypothetical protein [Thermoanaerobaculia bacterium]